MYVKWYLGYAISLTLKYLCRLQQVIVKLCVQLPSGATGLMSGGSLDVCCRHYAEILLKGTAATNITF